MSPTGTYLKKKHMIVESLLKQPYFALLNVPDKYKKILKDGETLEFERETVGDVEFAFSIRPYTHESFINQSEMLTVGEVCRILHVHDNTLRRWSDQGKIKTYRVGTRGDRRYKKDDVENYLKNSNIEKSRV